MHLISRKEEHFLFILLFIISFLLLCEVTQDTSSIRRSTKATNGHNHEKKLQLTIQHTRLHSRHAALDHDSILQRLPHAAVSSYFSTRYGRDPQKEHAASQLLLCCAGRFSLRPKKRFAANNNTALIIGAWLGNERVAVQSCKWNTAANNRI